MPYTCNAMTRWVPDKHGRKCWTRPFGEWQPPFLPPIEREWIETKTKLPQTLRPPWTPTGNTTEIHKSDGLPLSDNMKGQESR
jgi:hypothetical protein